ncbi:hypothetical protein [Eleftheria terrae]|uniref:hypothetical protein n=1 Tax=Eleftheria terrae TaxID=1597781 RepID=UPI00263B6A32|nr:hypothetical protein [Eleftheria terrae]WKB52988.1 hypothetical protein N7L95_00875 [Eleftheria terrae]
MSPDPFEGADAETIEDRVLRTVSALAAALIVVVLLIVAAPLVALFFTWSA